MTRAINTGAVVFSSLLVLLPLGAVIYGAFQTGIPGDPTTSFTLGNVAAILREPTFHRSIMYTALISGLVTVLAVAYGAALAWIIARTNVPLKPWLENLITVNNYIPPFVGAVAWIALGAPVSGFLNILWRTITGSTQPLFSIYSLGGIVWTMFLFYVPYAFLYTIGAFRALDPSLEEAAAVHGARGWVVLRTITLPLVKPALVSAAVLVFVLSAELFSIPGLLGGPVGIQTLAYRILLAIWNSPPRWPLASAAGLVLLVICLIGIYFYRRSVRDERRFITVTGKAYRPRPIDLGPWRWLASLFCWVYILFGVILPLGAIGLGSLMTFFAPVFRPEFISVRNWVRVLNEGLTMRALQNTTLLAIITPTIVLALALLLTYLIVRVKIQGRGVLDYLLTLPVAIPGIVFAMGMVWVYVRTPVYGTIWILLLAFVTKFIPQGIRNLNSAFLQIHPELEECSATVGANQWRTLWDITRPLLQPTILATWVLIFVSTVRELSASVMLYTARSTTLSVLIWDYLDSGEYTLAMVLCVMQVALILAIVLLARRLLRIGMARQEPG